MKNTPHSNAHCHNALFRGVFNSNTAMQPIPRRAFIKAAAVATGAFVLPRFSVGQPGPAANGKLNLAWIGLGRQGSGDLNACANGNNVVALVDVDPRALEKAKAAFPQAKLYKDFRVMLEEMGDSIDAVGVGTPDHTHFAATYMAMSMGIHVFVQKPLVHTIQQGRILQELAIEKKLVTQMGNQGHASEGARLVKEWYEADLIGDVREVVVWTNRPSRGYGFGGPVQTAFPAAESIPEGMDWNLWLGPCEKEVAFNKSFHPRGWRKWWDFGCGGLGDIGCHTIDTAYWALGLGAPDSVDVEMHDEVNPIFTPYGSVVHFNFPARGNKPPVTIKWYEGSTLPPLPEGYDQGFEGEGGFMMVGEKGGICHHGMRPDSPRLYPQEKWDAYKANPDLRVAKTLPRTRGIYRDWIDGIKNGKETCSNFDYAVPLTETILLGTLAIRTGQTLKWNASDMTISDNQAASKLINPEARKGWRIEDLA
ncbi:MAG: Gfo/Idh/MocA family oxidoreductase [Verrucomicrobia bacterium]|nr:Gfo/Idh/MocA family oxidoreductase [Verrucomicrobiota bacterium]